MDRHPRRQAYWQGKITEWAQSGQPVSVWCAEHGVSPGRFYLWRRRLQVGDIPTVSATPLTLVPIPQARPATSSGLEIVVGSTRVVLSRDFDPATLHRVLEVLGERPCG